MDRRPRPQDSAIPFSIDEGQEEVLRLLESITDGFCAMDAEWRFTFINQAARRIFAPYVGGDATDLLNKSHWDCFPGTEGTIIEEQYRRAVTEGVAVEFEAYYPPWGRWFVIRAYPMRGGGMSAYFRDITDAKEASEALRLSEERYRTLFNSIDEGFCVIDMIFNQEGVPVDYRFLEANPEFEKQTGLQDAIGHTARELLPGLEPHWFQIYGQIATTGEPQRFEHGSEAMGRWFNVYGFRVGSEGSTKVALLFSDITARRNSDVEIARLHAESAARLAEMETLLQVIPVGIGIAPDPECRQIRLNPAFANVLGLDASHNGSKTAPEDERPANFRCLDNDGREIPPHELPMQVAAREGREIQGVELNVVHDDGRVVHLLEYAAPLYNERGERRGSVGAFVDITERRQAEERQQFLVRLDDAIRPLTDPDAIVAVAARLLGEHLAADRCAYAEVEADEDSFHLTGDHTRGVPSIVGHYRFGDFGAEVLRLMRANQAYVVDDVDTHPQAPADLSAYRATRIRAVICVPLHKGGKFVAAMAVHQATRRSWNVADVDLVRHVANRCWESLERARVTRVLAESEERFRQIANSMPQVVWLAQPDGHLDYYNRRWYEFTGRAESVGVDLDWISILHPDDVQPAIDRWGHSVRTGEPFEFRYRWQDRQTGGYRWFLGRALPVHDERGKLVRWYGTSTDIDDLIRAEAEAREARAEAERANRSKDDFLAALSHELRTPLTPVLMMAAALREDERLPEDVRESLGMMQRNIELEARLIDDLLDITRIARGKLALRAQECEAHSLVALALEIVRDDAQAKGISLQMDLAALHSRIPCDPARLQQVFWNLLKNAVKFTPRGGLIAVRSRNDGANLVIEVSDTGIGIAPDAMDRIFLPFEQAGLTNDHRFGGLGLGLAISKTIVELHDGLIVAESDGLDLGATFRVALPRAELSRAPVAADGPQGIPAVTEPTQSMATRTLRLLVVEDHDPTLIVLSRLLSRAGHSVRPAASVAEARELAAREQFDAVISDIGLPDGTGIELMEALQTEHGLRGIALSGYGMEEDLRRSRAVGFVAHLVKPVDFTQLSRALAELDRSV